MFRKVFEYVEDNKLKITIYKNKIDILNYNKIIILEDEKIVIDCKEMVISIKGKSLNINKLYDKEILISGTITSIEFK